MTEQTPADVTRAAEYIRDEQPRATVDVVNVPVPEVLFAAVSPKDGWGYALNERGAPAPPRLFVKRLPPAGSRVQLVYNPQRRAWQALVNGRPQLICWAPPGAEPR